VAIYAPTRALPYYRMIGGTAGGHHSWQGLRTSLGKALVREQLIVAGVRRQECP